MTSLSTALRIPALATAGAAAAVLLAACGSSGGGTADTSAATSSAAGAGSQAPAAGSSQPAASGAPVTADLTEFHIALSSKSLHAGTVTFRVKNAGSIPHALTVDGPGVDDKGTGDMSPGQTKTLTVTLKAGTYDVFCPVGNHKMEGMDETVTVS